MNLLMQTATDTATGLSFPWAFTAVYVVGFIAAVGIGSIAWYNSKRPAGWESKKRPDFVPEVEKEEEKSVGEN